VFITPLGILRRLKDYKKYNITILSLKFYCNVDLKIIVFNKKNSTAITLLTVLIL